MKMTTDELIKAAEAASMPFLIAVSTDPKIIAKSRNSAEIAIEKCKGDMRQALDIVSMSTAIFTLTTYDLIEKIHALKEENKQLRETLAMMGDEK